MKTRLYADRPRILISRLSSFGDTIHGLPVLCALREHLPEAHLGWVVEDWIADLLTGHHALDEVFAVPRDLLCPWPRWKIPQRLPATWRLRSQLRASRFDVCIDVQGRTKSALAGLLAGAGTRIGFRGNDGRERSQKLNNVLVEPRAQHIIERNLELLEPLGIYPSKAAFGIPLNPRVREKIAGMLAAMGIEESFIVINPGAGHKSKLWPLQSYGKLAGSIVTKHGLPVLVTWAGKQEREMGLRIEQVSQGMAKLLPPTTIPELASLLSQSRLLVASDTGPLHLAAALGVPCVGLYGPTSPKRTGPYGRGHEVVTGEAMASITTGTVLAAIDRILR